MGTCFAACISGTLHENDFGRTLSRARIRIPSKDRGARQPQRPNEQSIPHPYAQRRRRIASAHRFALIAVLLACGIAAGSPPAPAFAESEVGHLLVGARIDYAGYNTTWMSVDGNAAYCATPMLATPRSGPYAKAPINAPSGRSAEAAADLWFGYGSPGFDKTLWPSTWYDGGEMTEARYAALTHILLSDTYSSSSASALYGCSESFRSWAQRQVIGFDSHGALINAAATGRRIAERSRSPHSILGLPGLNRQRNPVRGVIHLHGPGVARADEGILPTAHNRGKSLVFPGRSEVRHLPR